MHKFFHLPSLFVYVIAAVLLVTSIFHGAAFLRQSFYSVLGLTEGQVLPPKFSTEEVTFTPDAEEFLREYELERKRMMDRTAIIRSLLLLIFSLSFFAWFWSRTARSTDFEMAFSVRHFYFFVVSTISFLIFFFSSTQGIANLVQNVIFPESSFYFNYHGLARPIVERQTKPPARTVDKAELEEAFASQRREWETQSAPWQKRQMVDQFAVALVSLPVFYFHNRKFKF
ncbi:MAG: hypothetical protein KGZ92_02285 [Firmicutes bacterium]|nr:hypothetical protein [Dethiobacter sp.]MBS3888114.1 hypothetical protein [Bacillota bacterium]MBS4054558.1 hypothetical protein [Thermaerobacter sp.]